MGTGHWSKAAAGLVAAVAIGSALAAPAAAKQCVWNKGGYVLRVDWFEYDEIEISVAADGYTEIDVRGQAVQTDVFPTASGQCIDRKGKSYVAIVSICGGGDYKHRITNYPSETPDDQKIGCAVHTVTVPSTTRYLDFWGTIGHVGSGEGGPI